MYDVRARQWSPVLGAFLSADGFQYLGATGTLWSWPGQNPVRWSDPSGRWGTSDHNGMLDNTFGGILSYGGDVSTLKEASAFVDIDQSPEGSFKHGMTAPGQDRGDAALQTQEWLDANLRLAVIAEQQGLHTDAMFYLGERLHTLMDMTSPAHEGQQVWLGGFWPPRAWKAGIEHVLREWSADGLDYWRAQMAMQSYASAFEDALRSSGGVCQ